MIYVVIPSEPWIFLFHERIWWSFGPHDRGEKSFFVRLPPGDFSETLPADSMVFSIARLFAHKLQRFSDEQKTWTPLWKKHYPTPEKNVFVGKNKHIHITISRHDPQIPKRSHYPPLLQGNPRQRNTVAVGRNAQRCAVGEWLMRRSVAGEVPAEVVCQKGVSGLQLVMLYGCFQNRGTPKWMVYNGKPY